MRGRLTEPGVQRHLGFLYLHYRPQVYWWQVVELVQTLWLAVAASTAHRTGPFYSTLLANAVLALILLLLLRFKPMACRQVQLLAYASLGCQLLATYAALAFLPMDAASSSAAGLGAWMDRSPALAVFKEVLGGLVVAVNVVFVVRLAVVLLRSLPKEQLQAQWQRLQQEGRRARALLMQQLGVHALWGQHRQQGCRYYQDAEVEVASQQTGSRHASAGASGGTGGGGRVLQRLQALPHARFKDADVVAGESDDSARA